MACQYYLTSVLVIVFACGFASCVSIYKDTDVIKKAQRGGRQFNDIPIYEDDFSVSSLRGGESRGSQRWESAEWPRDPPRGRQDSYESVGDRPYDWYYYNKFITNGRWNHLYNGPHLDNRAGLGNSGDRPPKILPRPPPVGKRLPQ